MAKINVALHIDYSTNILDQVVDYINIRMGENQEMILVRKEYKMIIVNDNGKEYFSTISISFDESDENISEVYVELTY